MEWLNLHTSLLDSQEFVGSDPVQRATWICLMRYCVGQENGGRIQEAQEWADRRWQQVARVTREEVLSSCPLWTWDGSTLVVWKYPAEKEEVVRQNRENGTVGGKAKTQAKTQAARENGALGGRPRNPSENPSENPTEWKGMEGNGKEGECAHEGVRPPPPEDIPDWKLHKAEAARRKIAAIRPTITRLEAKPPGTLTPEAKAKLDKAKAEVYELETEIYGYGLKP